MEYVLSTSSLCKKYKHFSAINNLSMHVPKGSIYGFIGKNGSGKTTLIRIICGIQTPTKGDFKLYGVSSNSKAISTARIRIGAVVETPAVYLDLTAKENLVQQYTILGMPSFDGIDDLLALVGLSEAGNKRVKNFSLGMKQRLGIAIALAGNPDFLVLDEPINGLDPQGIIEIRELILKLNRENGITVLISSHILDELAKVATHFGFIDKGSIVKEISFAELENACRKCLDIQVTDGTALCMTLDNMGLDYRLTAQNRADVFAKINITQLALALSTHGCEILSVTDKDESLESYYIGLVGGDSNE